MTSPKTIIPAGLKKVPPFPPIAARLLALMAKPSVEIPEVAELIRSDATFTARVLQHANSAAFSFPSPIGSVDHAIALMGIERTRELVVLFGAGAYTTGALRTAEMRSCWQHSIATAVIAEQIAISCGMFTGTAFTAGIMHDVGRLGLLAAYPKQYEQLVRESSEQCIDILEFEREKFGVHHAEAGLLLAQRWGLPPEYHIIAGRHHDRCEGSEVDLLRIVHVACRMAQVLGYDLTRPLLPVQMDEILSELPPSARKRFETSAAQLSVQIERRILEFDCEEPDKTPDPVAAEAPAEEPDAPLQFETVVVDVPPAPRERSAIRRVAIIVMLTILAALIFWELYQAR